MLAIKWSFVRAVCSIYPGVLSGFKRKQHNKPLVFPVDFPSLQGNILAPILCMIILDFIFIQDQTSTKAGLHPAYSEMDFTYCHYSSNFTLISVCLQPASYVHACSMCVCSCPPLMPLYQLSLPSSLSFAYIHVLSVVCRPPSPPPPNLLYGQSPWFCPHLWHLFNFLLYLVFLQPSYCIQLSCPYHSVHIPVCAPGLHILGKSCIQNVN